MKYFQKDFNLNLEISSSVFQQIQLQSKSEYPNENGGMLAGHYSEDCHTVYIEQMVVPANKIIEKRSFWRNPEGLESLWIGLGKQGLRYVGEWHSHTDGSTAYSQTDLIAMSEIEKEIKLENPILLIVGVNHDGISAHEFYCYKKNELLKYKKMVDLRGLFNGLQMQMLTSLNVDREFIPHSGSKGDATEQHWIDFLRKYLPHRYKVDKAIVIDAQGAVSEQIDIVIYDAMYTPFIFNQDGFLYIPAESVYAVFEVKQDIYGNIEYAAQKIESVRNLQRTSIDMVSSGVHIKARLLTKIIGGILTSTNKYKYTQTISAKLKELKGYQTLDLGCCCDSCSFYVDYNEIIPDTTDFSGNIRANRECIKSIYQSREVKEIRYSDKEVSLFTFFLQLVSYLKSIGTVAAIDVNDYLKAINEKIDERI